LNSAIVCNAEFPLQPFQVLCIKEQVSTYVSDGSLDGWMFKRGLVWKGARS